MQAQITVGVIGVVWGSFLSMLIYRIPRGISVMRPSFCPGCGSSLRWYELIPVVSYLFLRGRCGHCGERIPLRYAATEITSAALAVLLYHQYGPTLEWAYWTAFTLALLLILQIDFSHFLIPNTVLGFALALTIAARLYLAEDDIAGKALTSIAVLAALYLFIWGFSRIIGKQAMGMGDIKLMGLISFALGWREALLLLWVAAIVGAIYGLILKTGTGEAKIPFGTLISWASILAIVFDMTLKTWIGQWLI